MLNDVSGVQQEALSLSLFLESAQVLRCMQCYFRIHIFFASTCCVDIGKGKAMRCCQRAGAASKLDLRHTIQYIYLLQISRRRLMSI